MMGMGLDLSRLPSGMFRLEIGTGAKKSDL